MLKRSAFLSPNPPIPKRQTVSVVVVTWNGLALLQSCVTALQQQTVAHELVIVDNDSRDGTLAWVSAALPDARVVALPLNTGFSEGNNQGIRAATGELVVLLNNDTVPQPDFLDALTAPFAAQPRLGATAGVLLFAHRPALVASAGIIVGRDLVHRDAWALTLAENLPSQPVPVWGASGGAVCYRRAALDDVGLFPPQFFAYLEDADLAWRLRLRGWETLMMPAARTLHVYSATSGEGSPFKQRLLARNRWWLLARCVPAAVWAHCAAAVRYDLLAFAYAAIKRQGAIARGRFAALPGMGRALHERRRIQGRRTAATVDLARWLSPPPTIRATLDAARQLDAVLGER